MKILREALVPNKTKEILESMNIKGDDATMYKFESVNDLFEAFESYECEEDDNGSLCDK